MASLKKRDTCEVLTKQKIKIKQNSVPELVDLSRFSISFIITILIFQKTTKNHPIIQNLLRSDHQNNQDTPIPYRNRSSADKKSSE